MRDTCVQSDPGTTDDVCSDEGLTVLMTAAKQGGVDAVDSLLQHGADVHARNYHGSTGQFLRDDHARGIGLGLQPGWSRGAHSCNVLYSVKSERVACTLTSSVV